MHMCMYTRVCVCVCMRVGGCACMCLCEYETNYSYMIAFSIKYIFFNIDVGIWKDSCLHYTSVSSASIVYPSPARFVSSVSMINRCELIHHLYPRNNLPSACMCHRGLQQSFCISVCVCLSICVSVCYHTLSDVFYKRDIFVNKLLQKLWHNLLTSVIATTFRLILG